MKLFNSIRIVRLLCRIAILEILRTFRLHKSRLVSIAFHRNILIVAWRFGCQTSQQGLCPLPTRCGHNPQASFAPPLSTIFWIRHCTGRRRERCQQQEAQILLRKRAMPPGRSSRPSCVWIMGSYQTPNSDSELRLPTLVRYCSWCH